MAMLTTKDVCDQLSISRSSVGRLVTDGELPCYKLGKSLRYCAYRLRNDGASIGKTVFITREEAEEVLEAMKDE